VNPYKRNKQQAHSLVDKATAMAAKINA